MGEILKHIVSQKKSGNTLLAILLDPDKYTDSARLMKTLSLCDENGADLIFVGGSLLLTDEFDSFVREVKSLTSLPVVLFPGSPNQISDKADGLLFLSLISGRNPELLIGAQVVSAPKISKTDLEVISTGYMLIDSGKTTTAHYVSQTSPIPYAKDDIAYATALAGEMLGLSCIYMDGGSGAEKTISPSMIKTVSKAINIPLIIGGGIRTPEAVEQVCSAGADIVVIGNVIETNPDLLQDLSIAAHRSRVES